MALITDEHDNLVPVGVCKHKSGRTHVRINDPRLNRQNDRVMEVSDFQQLWQETPPNEQRHAGPLFEKASPENREVLSEKIYEHYGPNLLREALDTVHFYIDATDREIVDHGFVDRNHVLEEARLRRDRLGQDGSNAVYIQPLITDKRQAHKLGLPPFSRLNPDGSVIQAVTEIPAGESGPAYTRIQRGDQGSITILNTGKDSSIRLVSIDDDVLGNKSLAQLLTVAHAISSAVNTQTALFIWSQNCKYTGLSITPSPLENYFAKDEVKALQHIGDYHPTDMVLLVSDQ